MIDIRTFMLVLAIGNIAFAMLIACYARSATSTPALQIWLGAKLVQGTAHLLGWMRPDLPVAWVQLGAMSGLIVGMALEVGAYWEFFGVWRWRRVLYPAALLALLAFHGAGMAGASASQQTAVMSVIIAAFAFATACSLLRSGPDGVLLRTIIGASDAIFSAMMVLRAYTCLVHGGPAVLTPSLMQALAYLIGYLLLILNGFGFLLLCKEKDDRQMVMLATVDSLTGLLNRRAFFERTERARALAVRLHEPIALLMLDIDHFKQLNDHYGHAAGDQALRVFATTAQPILREHDVMGRLGGEEFALLLPGTDLEGAVQAAERLRLAVGAASLALGGPPCNMTVSIGVVLIEPIEHINAALARADQALYAAKSAGRNCIQIGDGILRVA